jgi:hypothetical protein
MIAQPIVIRLLLVAVTLLVGSAQGSMLSGHASMADTSSRRTTSLPDEDETGLYEPGSFTRMDKVISICTGC